MKRMRVVMAAALAGAVAVSAAVVSFDSGTTLAVPSAPTGYTVSQIAPNSSLGPVTGLTELPDGDLLIAHQQGTIRRLDAGSGTLSTFATLPIAVGPDGAIGVSGLLDVLYLAPSTTAPAQVVASYTCFNGGQVVHCLRVYDVGGAVQSTNKYGDQLFRWQNPGSHNGGGLAHDADHLYVGTGDDTHTNDIAQDLSSLKGKILRFDRDRLSASPTIVAYGIRQPYGMFMHEGEIIEFDVGKDAFEEINRIVPDAANPPNMGWRAAGDGDATAWLSYPHTGPAEPWGFAVIGGDVWVGDRLYFADHPRGIIFSVDLDDPTDVQTFSSNWDFPTNLFARADGSLAVGTRGGGVWAVEPDGAGPGPTTSTTSTTTTTTSTPPGGGFDFGFAVAPRVDFTFAGPVTWSVSLAHDDSADGSGYHTHPQIPDTLSAGGSFSIERPVGHEAANIWWEVTATSGDGSQQRWRVDGVDLTWTPLDDGTPPPPPPPPVAGDRITYVAGGLTLPSKDRAFVDRLAINGYQITIVDDDDLANADLTGTVVVISTSVVPDKIDDLVATIDQPIVTFEAYLAHEIGVADGPNYAAGEAALPGVSMDTTAHPVTSGLSDPADVFSSGSQSWNRVRPAFVAADALVVGELNGNAVALVDDARRSVLLPWTWSSMDDLGPAGWTLFDDAVAWAATG